MLKKFSPKRKAKAETVNTNTTNAAAASNDAPPPHSPPPPSNVQADDDTILQSGNPQKVPTPKQSAKKKNKGDLTLESYKTQLSQEKSGKRKIFHSLVKVANELRRTRQFTQPILQVHEQTTSNWYEPDGLWPPPKLLPGVSVVSGGYNAMQMLPLFFYSVMVSALSKSDITQFAILYNILFKEIHYSARFDTSDVLGQVVLLVMTLVGGLYTYFDLIGAAAGSVCILLLLQLRSVIHFYHGGSEDATTQQVVRYCSVEILLLLLEGGVWTYQWIAADSSPSYVTWIGIVLGWRVPRALLAMDFCKYQNACKTVFLLLVGLVTSQLAVLGSEFIAGSEPSGSESLLMGSSIVLLFGILILYLDDSDTTTTDHAMSINSFCGFLFYILQLLTWFLTLSLGQGLETLVHNVLAPSNLDSTEAKYTIVGGYAGILLCLLLQSTLHVRRIPIESSKRNVFVVIFLLQGLCTAAVIGLALAVYSGWNILDDPLWFVGSLAASVVVLIWIGWLDYLVEVLLYRTREERTAALTEPLGFWWCVKPKPVEAEPDASPESANKLESLTPLLGEKTTDDLNYQSVASTAAEV